MGILSEEILGQDNAIWWSPDGQYFLFASFNDTDIGRYHLTYYGDMTEEYVEDRKLLYPKVRCSFYEALNVTGAPPGFPTPGASIKHKNTVLRNFRDLDVNKDSNS